MSASPGEAAGWPGGRGHPGWIGAGETLAFLERAIPGSGQGRAVLEVGCGRGEVAAGLVARDFDVLALDSDRPSIEAARALGVDARPARFPDEADELLRERGPFDAVLFVRVLHHVPLEPCLAAVRALLRPGGVLAIDDYDWAHLDEVTARFGHGLLGAFSAAGLAPPDAWGEPERAARDPLGAWREPLTAEGLHTGDAMRRAIAERLELVHEERAPYIYRYLARHLAPDLQPRDPVAPARVTAHALATERALIAAGAIRPLGQRFVARSGAEGGKHARSGV